MAALLLQFAQTMDAVAAVPGKLAKQAILAGYFKTLDAVDLPLAIRFASGRAFAATDERVVNVGGAIVYDVLLDILPIDAAELRRLSISAGEVGEAITTVWPIASTPEPITLAQLRNVFDELAQSGRVERKRAILLGILRRCADSREATYILKIMFRDLRAGAKEGVVQAAVAEASGVTTPAIQRAQMLLGDLGDVALLARENRLDQARFKLFHPLQFMLATPAETAKDAAKITDGRAWFAEDKLDGFRVQVHHSGARSARRIAIYTRTMDRADDSFPDVIAQLKAVEGDFLLDGEIVPWLNGAIGPFAHLQKRLGRKKPPAAMLARYPVKFIAFDLLYLDGEMLMDLPLLERRARLDEWVSRVGKGALELSPAMEVNGEPEIQAAFERAKNRRNEGLMLKDPQSIYSPGRRGQWWIKLKSHLPTLDCVVTAAEYGHGKRRNTLSDYTFAVWSDSPSTEGAKLLNIGKAYSGVTDEEIAHFTKLFKEIAVTDNGRVFQVRPQVVLEIAFDQIQKSDRHASGFAMRFPRIKRIRTDKLPEQADTLAQVQAIYQSEGNTSRQDEAFESEAEALPPAEPTLFDHLG